MTEVVAALIFKDNKFLICQRPKNKARAMLWEFVGGKVEKGETKEEALIRECREELDITVKPVKEFFSVVHNYPDITINLTVFISEIQSGEIKKIEHNDIKWIKVKEIENYDFCPADTEILDKIKLEFN